MKAEFELKNIRIPPVTVTLETDREKCLIILREKILDIIIQETIDLKAKACREGLIALGWTPPDA